MSSSTEKETKARKPKKEVVENNIGKATEEQIAEWRKKYGEVYELSAQGDFNETETNYVQDIHFGYFKSPSRSSIGFAMKFVESDPMKANTILFQNAKIECSDFLEEDDSAFLGICGAIGSIVKPKEIAIKKY